MIQTILNLVNKHRDEKEWQKSSQRAQDNSKRPVSDQERQQEREELERRAVSYKNSGDEQGYQQTLDRLAKNEQFIQIERKSIERIERAKHDRAVADLIKHTNEEVAKNEAETKKTLVNVNRQGPNQTREVSAVLEMTVNDTLNGPAAESNREWQRAAEERINRRHEIEEVEDAAAVCAKVAELKMRREFRASN